MIRLEVRNGPEEGRVIELGPGKHVLGRRAPSEIVLVGDAVSGRHLVLEVGADGQLGYQDLGSTNGTWSAGVKTESGAWPSGTDLRLGNLVLRRLDGAPDLAEEDSESLESEEHRRRRRQAAQALSTSKPGGPLVLLVLFLSLGGAAWYALRPVAEIPSLAQHVPGQVTDSGPQDLLDGLGFFPAETSSSWRTSEGVQWQEGRLFAAQSGRADFLDPLSGEQALSVQAEIQGGRVWPIVHCGSADSKRPAVSWAGRALGAGPVVLRFLGRAEDEFRLSLKLEAGAEVRALQVHQADESAVALLPSKDGRRHASAAGNLLLEGLGGSALLRASSPQGEWLEAEVGLRFEPGETPWLQLSGEGPLLVLTAEEPLGPTPGLTIAGATGLLWQGDQRLWMTFTTPVLLRANREGVLLMSPSKILLDWQLSQPLAEAARLDRRIQRMAQQGQTAALLQAVAELLHRWPLDADQVERAEALRAEAILRGRDDLTQLELATAEALFLGAVQEMGRVAQTADALAQALPQTDLADAAVAMAQTLRAESAQVSQVRNQQRLDYRRRLMALLKREYPLLAAWIEKEGKG